MIEKNFQRWDYYAVKELEQLCSTLPILPHKKAMAFFNEANRVMESNYEVVERQSGMIFESLMGVVNASDRKDFSVTYELASESLTNGVLMLETYDRVIGVLFCVARISENSFLTLAFTGRNTEAIKSLREMKPIADALVTSNDLESSISKSERKWWQFWK